MDAHEIRQYAIVHNPSNRRIDEWNTQITNSEWGRKVKKASEEEKMKKLYIRLRRWTLMCGLTNGTASVSDSIL